MSQIGGLPTISRVLFTQDEDYDRYQSTTRSAGSPFYQPRSPHHVAEVFEFDVGIRINGKERNDVEEYCISEGWIKVASHKALDRRGQPLLMTIKGTVEAFYK